MLKIEKGVPMPHKHKYPFALMDKGDSFLVSDKSKVKSARIYASAIGKKTKRKFTCHVDPKGLRIWRVA